MTMNRDDRGTPLEQAASWHVHLLSDDANEADWLAFERWLSADVDHREAYRQIEETWVEVGDLVHLIPESEHGSIARLPRLDVVAPPIDPIVSIADYTSRRPILISRRWTAIAAGIALFAIVFSVSVFGPSSAVTYKTAKGETRALSLADGSTIHLNSDSMIRVTLGRNRREVVMDDAEVSFDVAKDPGRPFIIVAGDRRIRVVGTEFNVLRHESRLTVTLRRGSLDVLPMRVGTVEPVRLSPGQELTHNEGQTGSAVRTVNADNAFAWQTGHLIYHDRPLEDVVSDLNRYFELPLRVDKNASALNFSGVLTVDTENAVVQRLEEFLPVAASRSETEIVLRLKSQP